jgi:DNA-directed RNA polymerase subunit H
MPKKNIIIKKHVLLPSHSKMSEADKKKLLTDYKITIKELPKIRKNDPALDEMDIKEGDIIRIKRKSHTAGETEYYRVVVSG